MNIIKNIIKNQKDGIVYFCLPKSAKINFYISITEDFDGVYSFFCACDDNYEPSFHLSLERNDQHYNLLMGRYNEKNENWYHLKSDVELSLNEEYSIEIFYGNKRNTILVGNSSDSKEMEGPMSFGHKLNSYLVFGDVRDLPNKAPVVINKFIVKDVYGNEKGSNLLCLSKPKVLDIEGCRIFS